MVETLRALGVPLCVVDGEADKMIADLAHVWNCPIVSDDSDFLLYDLPGGVISCGDMDIKTTSAISRYVINLVSMSRNYIQVYYRNFYRKRGIFISLPDISMIADPPPHLGEGDD